MQVNYSGWREDTGFFNCNIYIDELKEDYSLVYKDGTVAKQTTPFQYVTADWNCDGDRYEQFGAYFEGKYGGGVFYTPEDMVRAAVDALDTDRKFYDNDIIEVKGVNIPPLGKRKSIDEMIKQSEKRAFHREVERNSKMKALGIRQPGEPWAR